MCGGEVRSLPVSSDGNGADEDAILQHDAEDQEHKVQYEHGEAQHFAHLPATGADGDDDKQEHEEKQHDGAEQAVGADGHRLAVVQQSEQQPRDRQAKTREDRRVSFQFTVHMVYLTFQVSEYGKKKSTSKNPTPLLAVAAGKETMLRSLTRQ